MNRRAAWAALVVTVGAWAPLGCGGPAAAPAPTGPAVGSRVIAKRWASLWSQPSYLLESEQLRGEGAGRVDHPKHAQLEGLAAYRTGDAPAGYLLEVLELDPRGQWAAVRVLEDQHGGAATGHGYTRLPL